MRGIRAIIRRTFGFFQKRSHEAEMAEEMRAHLEGLMERRVDEGLTKDEARLAAMREFGAMEQIKEACREERSLLWADNLVQDLRYAARQLRRNLGFSSTAVAVLALGIGVNAAVFNLVHTLLFAPPTYTRPDQVLRVTNRDKKNPGSSRDFSYPVYGEIRDHNEVFSGTLAYKIVGLSVGEKERAVGSLGSLVTSNYFALLGVEPAQGRAFLPDEENPGRNSPVAVVSYSFWKKHDMDPNLLGSTIRINGRAFTIVGIAPEGFTGTFHLFSTEVWLPLGVYDQVLNDSPIGHAPSLTGNTDQSLQVLGRLRPGIAPAAAAADLKTLAAGLAAAHPVDLKDRTFGTEHPSRFATADNDRSVALIGALLLTMAFVVLLVACLNLASMLLARGAARRSEIAIRLAVGGTRGRIVRQLLTESLVLAVVGGTCGLVLAVWSTDLLISTLGHLAPVDLAWTSSPHPALFAATFAFCLLGILFFALGPALKLTRGNVYVDLKAHTGEERTRRRGRFFPRNPLVVSQIALSLALLTAAALFVHAANRAAAADTGLKTDRDFLVELDAGLAGYNRMHEEDIYRALGDRLSGLPGVESSSIAVDTPFSGLDLERTVGRLDSGQMGGGHFPDGDKHAVGAKWNGVGSAYFKTVGLPILRGRPFSPVEASQATGPRVAIINDILAQKLWPGGDALGRSIRFVTEGQGVPLARGPGGAAAEAIDLGDIKAGEAIEVVGIVPATRHSLFEKNPDPEIYLPFDRGFQSHVFFHIKFASVPASGGIAEADLLRKTVKDVDPSLPVISIKSFSKHLDTNVQIWIARAAAALFSVFGLLALGLAVVGTYGVMAYSVSRRTREIGIRMALGALPSTVRWMVLRDGLVMLASGVALGFALAILVGRVVGNLLYQVSPSDPLAFTVAPSLLGIATIVACWLPARRATRVDPLLALRAE